MSNVNKATNILASGLNIWASFFYYSALSIIVLLAIFNIYSMFDKIIYYVKNKNNLIKVFATIDNMEKNVVGNVTITNKNSNDKIVDEYLYNLTFSFLLNNEKIIIQKEEKTTREYYIG